MKVAYHAMNHLTQAVCQRRGESKLLVTNASDGEDTREGGGGQGCSSNATGVAWRAPFRSTEGALLADSVVSKTPLPDSSDESGEEDSGGGGGGGSRGGGVGGGGDAAKTAALKRIDAGFNLLVRAIRERSTALKLLVTSVYTTKYDALSHHLIINHASFT